MGDPALDSRPPPAFSYLGEAGTDCALLSHSPPPLCDLSSLEDQRRVPGGGISPGVEVVN